MAAFHRAFAAELRAIIGALPIHSPTHILDVGCGDGFYLGLFAEHLTGDDCLIGFDINPRFLELAASNPIVRAARCDVRLVEGALDKLPLAPQSCDLVWCAQSLYSLPEPVSALRQMAVAAPAGGLIAILENDTLHQLLLPWPSELEIALRTAEHAALLDATRRPGRYYVGRRLPALFAEAGLEPLSFRTQCIDRAAPLDADLVAFLRSYLERLAERVGPYLNPQLVRQFDALRDPDGDDYLLRQPHFTMTWLNMLAIGRKLAA